MAVTRFAVGIHQLSMVAVVAMAGTILTTYGLCVHQSHCPALPHLPTISNTWVYPPGTYISRFVVGNVAILMGLAQFAIYQINQSTSNQRRTSISNGTLCAIGFGSCVFLSFVGAICDNGDLPSCRGNNDLHSFSAVVFFVGYDAMMTIIALQNKNTFSERLYVTLSLMTKIRWIVPALLIKIGQSYGLGDETPLAIFEWTDVGAIMLWTVSYLSRGTNLKFGIVDDAESGAVKTYKSFPIAWVANLVTTMYLGTLVSCLAFYELQGRGKGIPYISDTFVFPPGDWISRWALVGGATCAVGSHLAVYFMNTSELATTSTKVKESMLTALACTSLAGLAIVGCVNESENISLHLLGASLYFGLYDVFMVLSLLDACAKRSAAAVRPFAFYTFLAIIAKVRFMPEVMDAVQENVGSSHAAQALEWADALSMCGFFAALMASNSKAHKYSFALLEDSASSQSHDEPLLSAVDSESSLVFDPAVFATDEPSV